MKLSKVIFLMAILLVTAPATSSAAAAIDLGTNTGIAGVNTTVPQSTLKVNVYPSTVGVGKSVKIIVSTAITNTPVSNADVYVKSAASLNWKYVGETDSNGQVTYKFSNAGLYTVKAEKVATCLEQPQ